MIVTVLSFVDIIDIFIFLKLSIRFMRLIFWTDRYFVTMDDLE